MFSRRSNWDAAVNRLTRERGQRIRRGDEILDLTVSNPTRALIEYPLDTLSAAMSRAARAPYEPEPLGIRSARETIAGHEGCDADDIIITASTSEAYSFLFKLLTDPGDAIVTATPSYPLLEHLAALDLVELRHFALEYHRRWELSHERLEQAVVSPGVRAIIVVNPNNPTGSYLNADEIRTLTSFGLPIISDEVFFEFPLDDATRTSVTSNDILTFTLSGLSKLAGLPHFKLGWIRMSGPAAETARARNALELIADNFLSVSSPVQHALPELLQAGQQIRAAILERTRSNFAVLQNSMPAAVTVLPVEGGWSAVLRVPRTQSDEDAAIALLNDGVVIQPGYFFDFDSEGFLVLSLLTPPDIFRRGLERIAARFDSDSMKRP